MSDERTGELESLGDAIGRLVKQFESATPLDDAIAPAIDERELAIETSIRRFVARGIEPAIAECIARDRVIETMAVVRAREWHASEVRGATLVLIGPPDQSKTFAASLCVALGAPLPPPAHYGHSRWEGRHAPRLVKAARLRRTMIARGLTAEAQQEELFSTTVLAIDDLGTEYAADVDSSKSILHELIDTRRGSGLWTLITSNLSAKSFYEFVDERMLSRLKSKGSGLINLHRLPQPEKKFRGSEP